MSDLVIGGPVRDRAWILPVWFEHVGAACDQAGVKPEFVFTLSREDHDTADAIAEGAASLHCVADMIFTNEKFQEDKRIWNERRYQHMVELRNQNLARVRELAPSAYLSLDSDLLLAPTALKEAFRSLERFDAVGMRCFMSPQGFDNPSNGQLVNGMLRNRQDATEGCFRVDCIMAAKLMGPAAYLVDYRCHPWGEDCGWSEACREAGIKLGWCADAAAKHVMDPLLLNQVDPRLGW